MSGFSCISLRNSLAELIIFFGNFRKFSVCACFMYATVSGLSFSFIFIRFASFILLMVFSFSIIFIFVSILVSIDTIMISFINISISCFEENDIISFHLTYMFSRFIKNYILFLFHQYR